MTKLTRKPLVSIVIPTRDRPEMLARALDSVLCQTAQNFEVIVVDDGSTNRDAISGLANKDSRINTISLAVSGGAPLARNKGVIASAAPFVAFLDDDDEWLPEKLELQLQRFEELPETVALVHCGTALISAVSGRQVHRFCPSGAPISGPALFRDLAFTTSNVMVRRCCFDAVGGFDVDLASAQDRDLWIRLALRFEIVGIPRVLVKRYIHGKQISGSLMAKIAGKERILEKHAKLLQSLPADHAYQLWRLGVLYCVSGEVAKGRRILWRAVRRYPWALESVRDLLTATMQPESAPSLLADRRVPPVDGMANYF